MKTHRITNSKHQAPETKPQSTIHHPPSALPFQYPPPPPSSFPMLSALIRTLNLVFDSILYCPTVPLPRAIFSPLSHFYCLKPPPQINPQSPPLQSRIPIPLPPFPSHVHHEPSPNPPKTQLHSKSQGNMQRKRTDLAEKIPRKPAEKGK